MTSEVQRKIPGYVRVSGTHFTNYIEFTGGIFLMPGIFKLPVFLLSAVDIILPMRNMKFIFILFIPLFRLHGISIRRIVL
jgi:hypothetical protein